MPQGAQRRGSAPRPDTAFGRGMAARRLAKGHPADQGDWGYRSRNGVEGRSAAKCRDGPGHRQARSLSGPVYPDVRLPPAVPGAGLIASCLAVRQARAYVAGDQLLRFGNEAVVGYIKDAERGWKIAGGFIHPNRPIGPPMTAPVL